MTDQPPPANGDLLRGANSLSRGPGPLLPPRQQRNAIWLLAIICCGMGLFVLQMRLRHGPLVDLDDAGPVPWQLTIDVNSARSGEFLALPDLGPELAEAIVAHRETLPGRRFASIEDLQQVRGIGPATLEQIRPWLRIGIESAGSAETGDDAPGVR